MIIFDLDGTLADCEHRRHFVRPVKKWVHEGDYWPNLQGFYGYQSFKEDGSLFEKPDWKSFYEACDQDKPIKPVLDTFIHFNHDVQIWSGRCESVREKTLKWLVDLTGYCEDYGYWNRRLKMRPVGDNTPDDQLKERWLDEVLAQGKTIDFVFDSDRKSIAMWRRRGIFVFNCCQHDGEF